MENACRYIDLCSLNVQCRFLISIEIMISYIICNIPYEQNTPNSSTIIIVIHSFVHSFIHSKVQMLNSIYTFGWHGIDKIQITFKFTCTMQTMLQTLDDLFCEANFYRKVALTYITSYNTWFYTYLAYHLSVMMILALELYAVGVVLELCQRFSHLAN